MIHLIFAPVLLIVIFAGILVRMITAPFRFGRWRRRHWGYAQPWGYGGFGRRPRMSILAIVALVALDRIFSGRRYY